MLKTTTGMRYPLGAEMLMLSMGAKSLAQHINERIQAETKQILHEGVILKPIKEPTIFHTSSPRLQIVTLYTTISCFFDTNRSFPMTCNNNSALESVYSCLFYEIKAELETPNKRTIRNQVYNVWDNWFHGDVIIGSRNLDEWVRVLDKLAARTVYEPKFAKVLQNFPTWVNYENITDNIVNHAVKYLEQLI